MPDHGVPRSRPRSRRGSKKRASNAVALGFVDPSTIVRVKWCRSAGSPHAATSGVGLSTLFNAAMSQRSVRAAARLHRRAERRPAAAGRSARRRCRSRRCRGGRGRRSTSTRRTVSRSPRVRARSRGGWWRRTRADGLSVQAAFEFEFSVGVRRRRRRVRTRPRGPGLQRHRARREPRVRARSDHDDARRRAWICSSSIRSTPTASSRCRSARAIRSRPPTPRWWCARRCGRWRDGTGRVSFAPQVAADTGNGTHLHVSLWEGDRNLLAGGRRAGRDAATGRGVHGRDPGRAAGARRRPGAEHGGLPPAAAASLVGRDAVLGHGEPRGVAAVRRRHDAGNGGSANVEVKPVDGTANPYLAVGAVLAAGCRAWTLATGCRPRPRRIPRACPRT